MVSWLIEVAGPAMGIPPLAVAVLFALRSIVVAPYAWELCCLSIAFEAELPGLADENAYIMGCALDRASVSPAEAVVE